MSLSCPPSIRVLAALLLLLLSKPASAELGPLLSNEWESWAEIGAVGSTELNHGEFAFFLPRGNESTLGFLDLRVKLLGDFDEDESFEGNFAGGVRHMLGTPVLGQGWNVGYWAGADVRQSVSDNVFWQFSSGVELLSSDWDLRFNGYVPLSKSKNADPHRVDFDLSGSSVLMEGAAEVPLYGVDGEVGWRIPLERWSFGGGDWQPEDHTVRIFVGGFYFDDDDVSEDVSGPRVRGEWRIADPIEAASGAELTFAFDYQWDEVRNSQWSGGSRVRFPIGPSVDPEAKARIAALRGQEARRRRRMTERIIRDVDVVVGKTPKERVEVVSSGVTLGRHVRVTHNTRDPEGAIESVGENGLAVLGGRDFRILINRAIQLSPGQVLLGSGNELKVRGRKSGVTTTYPSPGIRGQGDLLGSVTGATSGVLIAADDVTVQGVTVSNDRGNGIALFRNTNVLIDDVVIGQVSLAAVHSRGGSLDPAFHDQFTIRDSSLVSGGGIAVEGISRFTVDDTRISSSRTGLSTQGGDHEITINNSQIYTYLPDGHAVVLEGEVTLTLNDSLVRARGTDARAIQQLGAEVDFTVNNSTLMTINNAKEVVFATAGELSINNSTITSENDDAHAVITAGATRFTITGGSIETSGLNAHGVIAFSSSAVPGVVTLDGVSVRAERNAVLVDGDTFPMGALNVILRDNELASGFGWDEIAVIADGTSTIHLSAFDNVLDNGLGTIELNELAGTIRVVQGAPSTGALGIDVLNGIPTVQVEIPGNAVDYDQPFP